jgi:hypothetical protein
MTALLSNNELSAASLRFCLFGMMPLSEDLMIDV